MSHPRAQRWLPVLGPTVVAGGTLAYVLAFPPTLNQADESYLLYGAKRVLQGQAPYHDFFDFMTPFSFYYFALAYALGGVSVTSARVAMGAVNALSAALIYGLARQVAGPLEAVLAALLFVGGCLPLWPLASQHWVSTCLCLATAAALLSTRWQASTRLRPAVAGMLGGLVAYNQQQQGVPMVAWLAVAVPLVSAPEPSAGRGRRILREVRWAAGAGAVVCVGLFGYSIWRSSFAELVDATAGFVLTGYRPTIVGTMPWGGTFWRRDPAIGFLWVWWVIPIVLGLEAATLTVTAAAARRRGRPEAARAALLLLAVLMSVSILYFPDDIHLGFIASFCFIVAAGIVHRLRMLPLVRRHGVLRLVAGLGCAAVAVDGVGKAAQNLRRYHDSAPVRVATAFGTLAWGAQYANFLKDMQTILGPGVAAGKTVYSYPDDAWLYLVLPADNPLPFTSLVRNYNTPAQFRLVCDAIERGVPDYVVVNRLFGMRDDDPVVAALARGYTKVAIRPFSDVYGRGTSAPTGR